MDCLDFICQLMTAMTQMTLALTYHYIDVS